MFLYGNFVNCYLSAVIDSLLFIILKLIDGEYAIEMLYDNINIMRCTTLRIVRPQDREINININGFVCNVSDTFLAIQIYNILVL